MSDLNKVERLLNDNSKLLNVILKYNTFQNDFVSNIPILNIEYLMYI